MGKKRAKKGHPDIKIKDSPRCISLSAKPFLFLFYQLILKKNMNKYCTKHVYQEYAVFLFRLVAASKLIFAEVQPNMSLGSPKW